MITIDIISLHFLSLSGHPSSSSGGYPPNFIEEIPKVKGSDRYIYIYIYICTGILYKLTKFYRGPGAGFLKWSQYHSRTPGPHPQGLAVFEHANLRILLFHVICVLLSYYFLIMLLYMFTPCSCNSPCCARAALGAAEVQ